MRRTYRKKKWKPDKTQYRANERIRVPEVRLIGDEGQMLGVMPTKKALEMAQEKECDLIEVNPTARPPIAKLGNYGKIQYEQEKQKKKQRIKLKKVDQKGIRMSFRISDHDKDVRVKQAQKFLEKGHRVKIEMILRGREHAYTKQAIEKVQSFVDELKNLLPEQEIIIESPPKREGGRINSLISVKTK